MADLPGGVPLSPEQLAFEEAAGIREAPYPIAGPPTEPVGGTFQIPPERFKQPRWSAQWSPIAQAYVDPETQTVMPIGAGGAGAGTAGAGGAPAWAGGGGAPPGGPLLEHTEMTARAALGEQGPARVQELRAVGVPEQTIRARLGLGPELPTAAPAAPAAPQRFAGGGYGGGMAAPPKEVPEYLQQEFSLYYPPDFPNKIAAAAVSGDITNDQAKQLMARYQQWEKGPIAPIAKQRVAGLEAAEQAARTEADFANRALAAEQEASQAKQALLAQQRADQEAEANLQRAWQEDYDREYTRVSGDYDRAIEEAKRARVDPQRAQLPIIDALAAAMAQFAAILTGTPNAALSQINARLDRDIAAQEKEIQGMQANVAAQRNRLGLLRERFGDREMAMQAEKRLQLEQVQTRLQQIATGSVVEQNRLGAAKLAQDLEAGIQAMREQEKAAQGQIAQQMANAAQITRAQQAQAQQMAMTGMGPWQTKNADKMQARYIPGMGFAATEQAANKVREDLGKYDTTIRAFESLLKIAEQPGAATSPEMRARAQSLLSQADLGLAVANNLGAISAADADFVANQRGNPTALTDVGAKTRLQQTLGDLKANRNKALSRYAIIPGEVGSTMQQTREGIEPQISYRLGVPGAQMQAGGSIPEREVSP